MPPINARLADRVLPIEGQLDLWDGGHWDPDLERIIGGRHVWSGRNLIQNKFYAKGAAWTASNLLHPANGFPVVNGPGYIGIGNGTPPIVPTVNDTGLAFEVYRLPITSAAVVGSYTSRLVAAFSGIQPNVSTVTLTEMGLFDTAGYSGIAGSGTTLSLTDSGSPGWTVNQWANWTLFIVGGTDAGQSKTISSNTATTLTVGSAFSSAIDSTSVYCIGGVPSGTNFFAHTAVGLIKNAGNTLNVIWSLLWPNG